MFEPARPGCSFVIACGCCVSEAHLEPETVDFPVTSAGGKAGSARPIGTFARMNSPVRGTSLIIASSVFTAYSLLRDS